MEKNNKLGGHLALTAAYTIFGFNIVFCKDIAISGVISPIALYSWRAVVAAALFWGISFFMPKEKVERKDFPKILAACLLGLFIPQVTFLIAIGMTTTIDAAVLGSLGPIFTMFIAALVLKEPITFKKAGGVALSFTGALILIYNSTHSHNGVDQTHPLGIVLLLINALSFAAYLGIFRPLISKYHVVTFMKWMFLFSLMISLPFSIDGLIHADYAGITTRVFLEIAFLIVCATFISYLLIPIGQQRLRPTVVSMYSYFQPIIAMVLSVILGMDTMNWQKGIAILLVFVGVFLVNKSRAAVNP